MEHKSLLQYIAIKLNEQISSMSWPDQLKPKNPGTDSEQQRRYLSGLLPACPLVICHRTKFNVRPLSQPDSATTVRKWILPCNFILPTSFRPNSWLLSFPQREWSHPITQTFFLSTLCSSSPPSKTDDFPLLTCASYCSSTSPGTRSEETNSSLQQL